LAISWSVSYGIDRHNSLVNNGIYLHVPCEFDGSLDCVTIHSVGGTTFLVGIPLDNIVSTHPRMLLYYKIKKGLDCVETSITSSQNLES